MYQLHNPMVRQFSQQSARNLELTIAFVFSTIREKTDRLPRYMIEYRKRGKNSSWIWGNKIAGVKYIKKHREQLYTDMMKIIRAKKKDMDLDLMMLFIKVPGLGLPKAGFVVQLVAGKAGCMDIHNIRKYLKGMPPSWMSTCGNSESTIRTKAIKYLSLTKKIGGSKTMWNNWCTHISILYPQHFPTPNHVSEVHRCIWK